MKIRVTIISFLIILFKFAITTLSAYAIPVEVMPTVKVSADGQPLRNYCSSRTEGCSVSFAGRVGNTDHSYNAYAYGGISPYAFAGASVGKEGWLPDSTEAHAFNIYAFYIEPIGDVNGNSTVPIDFSYSINLNATAYLDINHNIIADSSASGTIRIRDSWSNSIIYNEQASIAGSGQSSYEKTYTKDLSLSYNRWYQVALYADATSVKYYGGIPSGYYYDSSATANVDPTIIIDPTWQYADSFKVVQFSVEPPPTSTIPEPSTLLLLGSSLGAFALISNRRLIKHILPI